MTGYVQERLNATPSPAPPHLHSVQGVFPEAKRFKRNMGRDFSGADLSIAVVGESAELLALVPGKPP